MGINAQVATVIAYQRQTTLWGTKSSRWDGRTDLFSLKDVRNINRNVGAGWTENQMEASVRDPLWRRHFSICPGSKSVEPSTLATSRGRILSMTSIWQFQHNCRRPPRSFMMEGLSKTFSMWRHHSKTYLICSRWAALRFLRPLLTTNVDTGFINFRPSSFFVFLAQTDLNTLFMCTSRQFVLPNG